MHAVIKIIVWVTLTLYLIPCFSQKQHIQSEFIGGINSNTAGWIIGGFVFKKSIKVGNRAFRTYGVEIMDVKHPQESRIQSYTGNYYIYGKINYLYSLRLQYGRDIILFKKANQSGVQIKVCVAAGLSLGIVSPYYIQWQTNFYGDIRHQQYDPNNPSHSYSRILGPGFLLEGFSESTIQPGVNCKLGFSFEIGTIASQMTGFEAGILLDAFLKKINLLAGAEKQALFPSLYITIFYGVRK